MRSVRRSAASDSSLSGPQGRCYRRRAFEHLWRIDILPPGLTDIDRERVAFLGHKANAVGQGAVIVSQDAPQIFEDRVRADEDAGVDRVVVVELLADRDQPIA